MKNFFLGFEKRANLLSTGAKLLTNATKTVAKHPVKSGVGALTAADVASSASKAARGGAGRKYMARSYP